MDFRIKAYFLCCGPISFAVDGHWMEGSLMKQSQTLFHLSVFFFDSFFNTHSKRVSASFI